MLRQMLRLWTGGARMVLGRVACTFTFTQEWRLLRERGLGFRPPPLLDGSREQDQGQTVKVGEQGSPLEETHFAGQYQGWPLPAGQGEPGVP